MEETKISHLASLGASPICCFRRRRKLEIFFESQGLYRGGKIGIFLNPRAYIGDRGEIGRFLSPRAYEGARAWNCFKSQRLYKGQDIGIFPSPRAYIGGKRSEVFQVPEPI